jgi:hypothetical protein
MYSYPIAMNKGGTEGVRMATFELHLPYPLVTVLTETGSAGTINQA